MLYRVSFLVSLLLFIGCEATTYERESDNSQISDKNPNQEDHVGTVKGGGAKQQDLIEGKNLYHSCAGCHGSKGDKSALGKSDLIGIMSESEIITALEGYRDGTRDKHGMGELMKGQVSQFSNQQILNIAKYMQETTISNSVINGRKIYGTKLSGVCQMNGINFVRQHTAKEWDSIYKQGKFIDEVYNICPTTKDIVKSSDEKDLYSYVYYYASK